MELKNYKAPTTETLNMSSYGNLLDWVVGSIGEGEGDVDAKVFAICEEDCLDIFEDENIAPRLSFNVWE